MSETTYVHGAAHFFKLVQRNSALRRVENFVVSTVLFLRTERTGNFFFFLIELATTMSSFTPKSYH